MSPKLPRSLAMDVDNLFYGLQRLDLDIVKEVIKNNPDNIKAMLAQERRNRVTQGPAIIALFFKSYERGPHNPRSPEDLREMLDLIIQHGADVNAVSRAGRNAMHYVVNEGEVDLLLERGLDINQLDRDGKSPLFHVRHQLVGHMIERGAKLDVVARNGDTLLHRSIDQWEFDFMEEILASGVPASASSENYAGVFSMIPGLLHRGSDRLIDRVIKLRDAGADVNCAKEGYDPPIYAAIGSEKALKLMLHLGADPKLLVRDKESAHRAAREAIRHDNLMALKMVHEMAPGWVDTYLENETTPIHQAVLHASSQCLGWLVDELNLDLDAVNKAGETPIVWAANRPRHLDSVKGIEHAVMLGANPHARCPKTDKKVYGLLRTGKMKNMVGSEFRAFLSAAEVRWNLRQHIKAVSGRKPTANP